MLWFIKSISKDPDDRSKQFDKAVKEYFDSFDMHLSHFADRGLNLFHCMNFSAHKKFLFQPELSFDFHMDGMRERFDIEKAIAEIDGTPAPEAYPDWIMLMIKHRDQIFGGLSIDSVRSFADLRASFGNRQYCENRYRGFP